MNSTQLSLFDNPKEPKGRIITNWLYKFGELHVLDQQVSLFTDLTSVPAPLAKVKVSSRIYNLNKKVTILHIDKSIHQFLPAKFDENSQVLNIPIISTELIAALTENNWSTNKDGNRNFIKAYPLCLEVECGDFFRRFEFDHRTGYTPALAAEAKTNALKEGEYLETTLNLY